MIVGQTLHTVFYVVIYYMEILTAWLHLYIQWIYICGICSDIKTVESREIKTVRQAVLVKMQRG